LRVLRRSARQPARSSVVRGNRPTQSLKKRIVAVSMVPLGLLPSVMDGHQSALPEHWGSQFRLGPNNALSYVAHAAGYTLAPMGDIFDGSPPTPTAQTPDEWARVSLQAARSAFDVPGGQGLLRTDTGPSPVAGIWSLYHALRADLGDAEARGDRTALTSRIRALSLYRDPKTRAYAPGLFVRESDLLYDDNEWIGRFFLREYLFTGNEAYLAEAVRLFDFLESGISKEGAVYWRVTRPRLSQHSCSTWPLALMAEKPLDASARQDHVG